MRLINVTSHQLEDFFTKPVPKYAILSHTWGENEISHQDYRQRTSRAAWYRNKDQARAKIEQACVRALRDGLDYLWIDTCCIDKSSSAELSEAINSMYQYYARAEVCYVYMADVAHGNFETCLSSIASSRWWSRGWTLQEFLAPQKLLFVDYRWQPLIIFDRRPMNEWPRPGLRRTYIVHHWLLYNQATEERQEEILKCIANHTRIAVDILSGNRSLSDACIAERMSWSAERQTSREEDVAYSLLGIFDISMPLLYGEGRRAFIRLQAAIASDSDDHSIFAWGYGPGGLSWLYNQPNWTNGFLAVSPGAFLGCDSLRRSYTDVYPYGHYAFTNKGIQMTVPLLKLPYTGGFGHLIIFDCHALYAWSRHLASPLSEGNPDGKIIDVTTRSNLTAVYAHKLANDPKAYTRWERCSAIQLPLSILASAEVETVYLDIKGSQPRDGLRLRQSIGELELSTPGLVEVQNFTVAEAYPPDIQLSCESNRILIWGPYAHLRPQTPETETMIGLHLLRKPRGTVAGGLQQDVSTGIFLAIRYHWDVEPEGPPRAMATFLAEQTSLYPSVASWILQVFSEDSSEHQNLQPTISIENILPGFSLRSETSAPNPAPHFLVRFDLVRS